MRAVAVVLMVMCAPAAAQPEPTPLPPRYGVIALGFSGDRKWYKYENAIFMEGTVRPSRVPFLFAHVELAKGGQDYDDLGGFDTVMVRAGGEAFDCLDRASRHLCGFAGVDIGYLSISGQDDVGGAIVSPRFGLDVGGRYVRGRIGLDITRPFGDQFDRMYTDAFDRPVSLELADMTYVFVAVGIQL